jgi:hypothetical protein
VQRKKINYHKYNLEKETWCSKQKNLKNRLQTNIEKQYTNILSILEKNCVDLGISSWKICIKFTRLRSKTKCIHLSKKIFFNKTILYKKIKNLQNIQKNISNSVFAVVVAVWEKWTARHHKMSGAVVVYAGAAVTGEDVPILIFSLSVL